MHAEERLIFRNPKSLTRIVILRVGMSGNVLPIKACKVCERLAKRNGIKIESI